MSASTIRRALVCAASCIACATLAYCGTQKNAAAEGAGTPSAAAPSASAPMVKATENSWPVFRGNGIGDGVAAAALPDSLEVLWEVKFAESYIHSTAAIVDGVVYVGTLERQDGAVVALDLADGEEKWRFNAELGFSAPIAVRDGRVYAGDDDGTFHCINAKTGKEEWNVDTNGQINAGANFHGDKVIFGSQDGGLFCLDAKTGAESWKYSIEAEGGIQGSPTIVGGRTFVAGCDGILHIIDVDSGTEVAKIDLHDPTFNTPAAAGDFAFVAGVQGTFYSIDWTKEQVAWTYQNAAKRDQVRSSAALAAGLAIFGGNNKFMHAVELAGGKERWTFPARTRIESSPVVAGNRVYFGALDGRLYALNVETGTKEWEYECGGKFQASPAVAGGRLVIGNRDGTLYCFGKK